MARVCKPCACVCSGILQQVQRLFRFLLKSLCDSLVKIYPSAASSSLLPFHWTNKKDPQTSVSICPVLLKCVAEIWPIYHCICTCTYTYIRKRVIDRSHTCLYFLGMLHSVCPIGRRWQKSDNRKLFRPVQQNISVVPSLAGHRLPSRVCATASQLPWLQIKSPSQ